MVELGLNRAEPATLVVDLNCAFASIEQQHDPSLRGRPLAIAAYATDAATIVSSSRDARDLGIKTGMRVFEAKAIFPRVLVREPNPPLYREVSDKLIEIMERHSPDVLRMSIDEASTNLAGTPGLGKGSGRDPLESRRRRAAVSAGSRGGPWASYASPSTAGTDQGGAGAVGKTSKINSFQENVGPA